MAIDIIALASISYAGVVSIIHAIQQSKCDIINFGCLSCHRVVKQENEQREEQIPLDQVEGRVVN